MKRSITVPREGCSSVSEGWGRLCARRSDLATDGGSKARPTAGTGTPRRSWLDLLLAAAIAVALHLAFFASGRFVTPEQEPAADLTTLANSVEAMAIPLSLDAPLPASAVEQMDAERTPASSGPPASASVTIVPLDLFRSERGTMGFICARLVPVLDGRGVGFRPDRNALCTVGRGTRVPVFEVAELDRPPVILAQPLPQYPPSLLRTGANGEVLVCLIVGIEGTVRAARVTQATHPEFAVPALQAVARWKFRPGRKDGRAVATRVEVPIAFKRSDTNS